MKTTYVVVPLFLVVALTAYATLREKRAFVVDGPGSLTESTRIMFVDHRQCADIGILEDRQAIGAVVALLMAPSPTWNRGRAPSGNIDRLVFASTGSSARSVGLGENFAQCGRYVKELTPEDAQRIRKLLGIPSRK